MGPMRDAHKPLSETAAEAQLGYAGIPQRALDAVVRHSPDSSEDFKHFRCLNIDIYLSAIAFKLLQWRSSSYC